MACALVPPAQDAANTSTHAVRGLVDRSVANAGLTYLPPQRRRGPPSRALWLNAFGLIVARHVSDLASAQDQSVSEDWGVTQLWQRAVWLEVWGRCLLLGCAGATGVSVSASAVGRNTLTTWAHGLGLPVVMAIECLGSTFGFHVNRLMVM